MELNYDRLVQQTESWLPIVLEYSGKVALALLTLAIGWWLINTLTGRVGGLLARRSVDRTLQGFVGSLVSIVLKILLVVSVASMIGIQTTSFVA
ncbi:TPA: mechanosensitive ion channel family protein, partial [Pseudomonas aeruginosa]|nr:mechanosensitive ion channel family protein [Pseudomonas aeruginosa]